MTKYQVIGSFKVKTSQGERELQAGQIITLPKDKAIKLVSEGKITPTQRAAYKVFSEVLGAFLWVAADEEGMTALRGQGISEPIYTGHDIQELKKLSKETLKSIHKVKEVFPLAVIQEITQEERGDTSE